MFPGDASKNDAQGVKETILVVEDDPVIRRYLHFLLSKNGYKPITAETAQEGMVQIGGQRIDLVLLDLGLPDMDGMQLLEQLRNWDDLPILILTARDREEDKVAALDLGADDYVTKPFSSNELLARIRVCLRHYSLAAQPVASILSVGELSMDCDKHRVYLQKEAIHLTPLEYDLLHLLLRNKGKVLSTKFLIEKLYGKNYGEDTQALRALMSSLRRKIEETPTKPKYIRTEVGVGYRMVE